MRSRCGTGANPSRGLHGPSASATPGSAATASPPRARTARASSRRTRRRDAWAGRAGSTDRRARRAPGTAPRAATGPPPGRVLAAFTAPPPAPRQRPGGLPGQAQRGADPAWRRACEPAGGGDDHLAGKPLRSRADPAPQSTHRLEHRPRSVGRRGRAPAPTPAICPARPRGTRQPRPRRKSAKAGRTTPRRPPPDATGPPAPGRRNSARPGGPRLRRPRSAVERIRLVDSAMRPKPLAVGTVPASTEGNDGSSSCRTRRARGNRRQTSATCAAEASASDAAMSRTAPASASAGSPRGSSKPAARVHGPASCSLTGPVYPSPTSSSASRSRASRSPPDVRRGRAGDQPPARRLQVDVQVDSTARPAERSAPGPRAGSRAGAAIRAARRRRATAPPGSSPGREPMPVAAPG